MRRRPAAVTVKSHPPGLSRESVDEDSRLSSLYRDYWAELTAGIRGRFGDGPPHPDDVAQEAFRRVIEQPDISKIVNLRAFIWRTARNLVLDAKKHSDVRSRYDFEVEQVYFPLRGENLSPEVVITAREQIAAINKRLLEMPERRRRSLMLYRIDGLTLAQIASRLEISITSVRKHIACAQAELHALFIDEEADDQ